MNIWFFDNVLWPVDTCGVASLFDLVNELPLLPAFPQTLDILVPISNIHPLWTLAVFGCLGLEGALLHFRWFIQLYMKFLKLLPSNLISIPFPQKVSKVALAVRPNRNIFLTVASAVIYCRFESALFKLFLYTTIQLLLYLRLKWLSAL